MKPTRVLLTAATSLLASNLMAGEAVFYVTEDGNAMRDIAVSVNGQKQLVNSAGFAKFDIPAGAHRVELSQFGEWVGEFDFDTASAEENAEVQVDIVGGEAMPDVKVYLPGQVDAMAVGQISGTLISDETGGPVSGARIAIEGTDQAVMTDENGEFAFELPRGEYALTIAHPNYGKRDVTGLRVMSGVTTGVNMTMSMSGNGTIEEVVAVGSYIPSTVTAQERDASGVLDAIGSEQMSRFGDSSAASALKRVTGVTISGGKYAIVRGLNERYTSVLFNGAMLPSPDPTRRVVPLDIFPSAIISSLNVTKTGSANNPVDSAGATIDILSKEAESERAGKIKVSLGYLDGTTGESARVQKTSGLEVLGIGSSDRDLSGKAKALKSVSSSENVTGLEGAKLLDLSQWKTEDVTIKPNTSLEGSFGDVIGNYDIGEVSYKATARYSNKWNREYQKRATYTPVDANGNVEEQSEYYEDRVSNDIDLSSALVFSLMGDNYSVNSNTMLLRNTQQESNEQLGLFGEYRTFEKNLDYIWQERQFFMQQFTGDILFPETGNAEVSWGLTFANASLNMPDSRSYSLYVPGSENTAQIDGKFNPLANDLSSDLRFSTTNRPARDYLSMKDKAVDFTLDGKITALMSDSYEFNIGAGLSLMSRKRNADAYSFVYGSSGTLPDAVVSQQDIVDVLVPSLFESGNFYLTSRPDYAATYDGTWDYSAVYLMPEYNLYDVLRVEVGARLEDSKLSVVTERNPDTLEQTTSSVSDNDLYPSINITYLAIADTQLRLSYYDSINRPDFREISPSAFRDSSSGDTYKGNENLTAATIQNYDARAEYYFSENEKVSLGLFYKIINNAIERTTNLVAGSSDSVVYGFDNGGDAYAQGIELSASKDLEFNNYGLTISGNTSFIDTQVEEVNDSGNISRKRALQGQPDSLANLQFAFDHYATGIEAALVINYTGESLFAIPTNKLLPDEMSLARTVVDINAKYPLAENMAFTASIDNLTNSEVRQEQGGKLTKAYKPGQEFNLGFSYVF